MSTCSGTPHPTHNVVCVGVAALDASLTRMGSDTHQTRCVPQPAPVARGLSIPALSVALAQWQCLWHMSQSFKCLLFSAGWLGARRSQGKDDILCRVGGNLLWLLSSCLLRLSAPVSSEHIKTQTNKPCHFETLALVTRLLSGMSSRIWSHGPVGSREVYKCMQVDILSHTQSYKPEPMFKLMKIKKWTERDIVSQTLHQAISDLFFICLWMSDMLYWNSTWFLSGPTYIKPLLSSSSSWFSYIYHL